MKAFLGQQKGVQHIAYSCEVAKERPIFVNCLKTALELHRQVEKKLCEDEEEESVPLPSQQRFITTPLHFPVSFIVVFIIIYSSPGNPPVTIAMPTSSHCKHLLFKAHVYLLLISVITSISEYSSLEQRRHGK